MSRIESLKARIKILEEPYTESAELDKVLNILDEWCAAALNGDKI